MKKATNKEMFNMVMAMVQASPATQEDVNLAIEFLQGQIDSLDKKAANKKPTKAQLENEGIKESLKAVLEMEGMMSISQLQALEAYAPYSNQKLSALLNQMVKAEIITKAVGTDRKTVFGFENPKTEMVEENPEMEIAPTNEGQLIGDIDRAHELALLWQEVINGEMTEQEYEELVG